MKIVKKLAALTDKSSCFLVSFLLTFFTIVHDIIFMIS